jgi:hypothetical protein
MTARQYAVLFSAASEAVYGPDLVSHERFAHAVEATALGQRVRQASGLEYELMKRTPDGWRSMRGETAVAVIRRRWA